LDTILVSFNVFLNAQEMAKRIENLRIPLEIALVKLSAQPKAPEQAVYSPVKKVEPPLQRIPEPNLTMQSKPAAVNEPHLPIEHRQIPAHTPVKHQETNLELEKIKELWPQFIEKVNKTTPSAAHYLEEGKPCKAVGTVLTIGFPKHASFNKESLEGKENHLLLEKLWKEILRQDIRIHFTLTHGPEPEKPADSDDDPLLKSTLDTFNGRVIRKG
jgi:hypothetical protein